MPSESINVFVSYSHTDVLLVSPVVRLLRVNKSFVFQDIDRIQPGKRWRGGIAEALAESQLVVVFWCTHASGSNEVSKEWQAAIEQEKDLLPVLLDATPLPSELAEFQWIDFRGTVGANHSSIGLKPDYAPAKAAPSWSARSSARRILLTACATACAAVLGVVLAWFYLRSPPEIPPPQATPPPTPDVMPPPQLLPKGAPFWGHLLYPVIVLIVIICLIYLSKSRLAKPIQSSQRPPGDIERHIASKVEAEILRRATLRRESGK